MRKLQKEIPNPKYKIPKKTLKLKIRVNLNMIKVPRNI